MPTLEHAISLATQAHQGQVDKAGHPYILHPLRVMFAVEGETARIIAVLHDVVEDSDVTFEALREMGYTDEVITGLACVTRRDNETYMEFVERAKQHPIARQVKLADIEDNMDMRRLQKIRDKDVERLRRYRQAWAYLKDES